MLRLERSRCRPSSRRHEFTPSLACAFVFHLFIPSALPSSVFPSCLTLRSASVAVRDRCPDPISHRYAMNNLLLLTLSPSLVEPRLCLGSPLVPSTFTYAFKGSLQPMYHVRSTTIRPTYRASNLCISTGYRLLFSLVYSLLLT
ncbi:hypothetical protein K523DRAFT_416141 [Schizophyllum commune Tattone D]|nr:hypothetical protein K523DRAFT_416141 [Schizophyllum commune Tattone D]